MTSCLPLRCGVGLTIIRVGRIIGTGIFSTPSSVTAELGSVGASLMFWVLGFFLAASGLCVWLEFASMIPRSGGEKNYLEAVYKKPKLLITIVFAVQAIALGFTGTSDILFSINDQTSDCCEKHPAVSCSHSTS